MNYANGLKILRKVEEDERNWRSGMQQIKELLQAAEQADQFLRDAAGQRQALQEDVARLSAEETALKTSVELLKKEAAGWKSDVQEKKKIEAQRISELDAMLEAKEQRFAKVTAKLEEAKTLASR